MITFKNLENTSYYDFLKQYLNYLEKVFGLNTELAKKVSVFILYNYFYGNSVKSITSGFRDPKKQADLLKDWNEGRRAGLVAKPAVNSKHTVTNFLGQPDSLALDISFQNQSLALQLSPYFGLQNGASFNDPVHFFI